MARRPPIRVLDLAGDHESIGARHGATFAEKIRSYLDDRRHLVQAGGWTGGHTLHRAEVLDLAEACVPHHEAFDTRLFAELRGLARGAGISLAEAVIVGGFTDFVDVVRAAARASSLSGVAEDDCTAFLVPASRAGGTALFGQTWDMHDTATDRVVVLRLRPDDGPAAAVFTTTGCVGQLGLNEHGVCVGVNNLSGADGRPGVTWPSVVRAMLACRDARAAREVLLDAPLAGAHSYLVLTCPVPGSASRQPPRSARSSPWQTPRWCTRTTCSRPLRGSTRRHGLPSCRPGRSAAWRQRWRSCRVTGSRSTT
jgi:isopenicillin-N N-acyltransferase-like protein